METGQTPEAEPKTKQLSPKHKKCADFYLGAANLNITKAAIMAEYSERSAYSTGHDILRRPEVRAYINERLEAMTLGRSEVLTRLTNIANGSIEDFLDEDGNFDYKAAKKAGKLGIVKKLKRRTIETSTGTGDEAEAVTTHIVEFELYSAHEALRDLGKYHKLFTDKFEHSGPGGIPLFPKDISLTIDTIYGSDDDPKVSLDEPDGSDSETGRDAEGSA